VLIGRPAVVEQRLERFGLSLKPGIDFELIDPQSDPRYRDYVATYHERTGRRGVTPDAARTIIRTSNSAIAAVALERGDVDAMICGVEGRFNTHLRHIRQVIGLKEGANGLAALSLLITSKGPLFLADTHVTADPSPDELADMVCTAAEHVRRFGLEPKIALVSHSDFGSHDDDQVLKMQRALKIIRDRAPDLEVEGEMHADSALLPDLRERVFPGSRLKGVANVLIMPNMSAANIAFQVIKVLADALPVGPILVGQARPAHILTSSVTARGVVNMTALAVVEAQERAEETIR
jgi:malate dehydrogenase (oxaloacetate-decarboxylating)(NADP+)